MATVFTVIAQFRDSESQIIEVATYRTLTGAKRAYNRLLREWQDNNFTLQYDDIDITAYDEEYLSALLFRPRDRNYIKVSILPNVLK